jgi:hypothetical protein
MKMPLPLFIPLKAEYFDAFERGEKTTEYRPRNKQWNSGTCTIGRAVLLSRGYGKQRRLTGKIVGCHYDNSPSRLPGWTECYGDKHATACCIAIQIHPQ